MFHTSLNMSVIYVVFFHLLMDILSLSNNSKLIVYFRCTWQQQQGDILKVSFPVLRTCIHKFRICFYVSVKPVTSISLQLEPVIFTPTVHIHRKHSNKRDCL